MSQRARTCALGLLLAHHVVVWVNLAQVPFSNADMETKKRLRVFKDMGPRFLTNWNFFNQTAYIVIALLVQVRSPQKFQKPLAKLRKINWYHFWSIVLPWTIFIPILFWSVYHYDRELIFPKVIDHIFPTWMNHAVHTNILALLLLELTMVDERPPRFNKAVKTLTVYAIFYVSVLVFTFFKNNIWLYGFLGVIDWPQRIALFLGIYGFLVACMWMGISLQNCKQHQEAVCHTPRTTDKQAKLS